MRQGKENSEAKKALEEDTMASLGNLLQAVSHDRMQN